MTQYCVSTRAPSQTREFVARGVYKNPSERSEVVEVLRREVKDFITFVKEATKNAQFAPLYLHSEELIENFDPKASKRWARRNNDLVSVCGYAVAMSDFIYKEESRLYYSIKVTLEGTMCDYCGTGTGPCKEEPTSNVAVEAIVKEMAVLSEEMKELEQDMLALVQKLRDLNE